MLTLESKEAGLTIVLPRTLSRPEGRFNAHTRQCLPAGNGLGMGVGWQTEAGEDAAARCPFPRWNPEWGGAGPLHVVHRWTQERCLRDGTSDCHVSSRCGQLLDLRFRAAGQNGLSTVCFSHSSCSLVLSLRQRSVLGAKSHHGQHVGSRKNYRKLRMQPGWPWAGPRICLLGGHGLGGFSGRHWFSHSSGGQKPEV